MWIPIEMKSTPLQTPGIVWFDKNIHVDRRNFHRDEWKLAVHYNDLSYHLPAQNIQHFFGKHTFIS